jgi:hypothetical protein
MRKMAPQPPKRRTEKKKQKEAVGPVEMAVRVVAVAGIVAALYYLYTRTRPPDTYEQKVETVGPRLDAPTNNPKDPISVSDKPPGK